MFNRLNKYHLRPSLVQSLSLQNTMEWRFFLCNFFEFCRECFGIESFDNTFRCQKNDQEVIAYLELPSVNLTPQMTNVALDFLICFSRFQVFRFVRGILNKV